MMPLSIKIPIAAALLGVFAAAAALFPAAATAAIMKKEKLRWLAIPAAMFRARRMGATR